MTDVIEQPVIDSEEIPDDKSTPDVESGAVPPEIPEQPEGISADHLASVRDLIALAHQDIVPELLTGDTVEDLLASVPAARDSYQRLEARFSRQADQPGQVSQPLQTPAVVDLNAMSTDDLLRQGMIERRGQPASRPWPKRRS